MNIETQSIITLTKTDIVNKPSKHIDVRLFFIKKVMSDKIYVKHNQTNKQIADCLTKTLKKAEFEVLRNISKFNPNLSN